MTLEENVAYSYTMSQVFNNKTKRFNTIKTALKNGILEKPNDFTLPEGMVFVKTGKGYTIVNQQKSNKYVNNKSDLLPVNRNFIFNPFTKRVIKNTEENIKTIKKERKIKKALTKVSEIQPSLSQLRKTLFKYNGQKIVAEYIVNGKSIVRKEYDLESNKMSSTLWKKISLDWIIDSMIDVFTANDFKGKVVVYNTYGVLTSKKVIQKFRDGITNCLLTPIKNWINTTIYEAKSDATKAKYRKMMKKINEMMDKYVDGVPETEIDYICNELQIDINIDLPFNIKNFINCKSTKKALHKFNYINSRLNHIDNTIVSNDNVEYLTQEQLNEKYKEVKNSGEYYTFTRTTNGIGSLKTIDKFFSLENDYLQTINEFEYETGLINCKIDDVKQKDLSEFVKMGTHYNTTIDFKQVWGDESVLLNWEDYIHIDMEKAYANFHKNTWYNGFLGKITDFRAIDWDNNKALNTGIYQIYDLDFTNANDKFVKLNEKMKIYVNDGVYPTPDLDFLNSVNVKYKVKGGCWGVNEIDFDFNDAMINGKDDNGVRYYCKWAGKCDSHNLTNTFRVKGNMEYANVLNHYANEKTKVHYDEYENEICVYYPKLHNQHLGHITAFLTSYQRTSTLEQLMNLEYDKIVRVCVDGIYFEEHDYELKNVFRTDKKGTFNNQADECYISNIEELYNKPFANVRRSYKNELHLGCGGCGKTHLNLVDNGLVKALFVAPSWKLAMDKKNNYNCDSSVWARILSNDPEKTNYIKKYANVLIIDEVSMMTEGQKQQIFETYDDMKIIMCGDLGFQLPPIEGEMMNKEGFDLVKNDYGESRRFKCEELRELCNALRNMIEEKTTRYEINCYVNKYFNDRGLMISSDEIDYKVEDMILTGTNKHKDYFTEKYKNVGNKWYIKENNRVYQNGCIVIGDKPENTKCELRHAFTTHSIQGETAENNLFIDISKMFDMRMFYTAISRAKYLKQIRLIKPSDNMKKTLFKKSN